VLPLAIPRAWAVGRMGKPLLSGYKRLLRGAKSTLEATASVMGLGALALRHSRLHAEVKQGAGRRPGSPAQRRDGGSGTRLLRDGPRHHRSAAVTPEATLQDQRDFGSLCLREGHRRTSRRERPLRFERKEDVPEDLAMSMAVNVPSDFMTNSKVNLPMLIFLTWAARAAPEQLYLPHDFLKAIHGPWEPEKTLRLLRLHRDYYRVQQQKPAGPSRQGPCPLREREEVQALAARRRRLR